VVQARRILDDLDTVNLTRALLDAAADLGPARLRTLDAIHLAAAQRAGTELRVLLTYDSRMAAAAADLGMAVEGPT
jgi:predicted nucleic acid-binding protein